MSKPLNWQSQNLWAGSECYVPVRQMGSGHAWGRIGGTQVTFGGVCPPRAVFIPRLRKSRRPAQNLMKVCTLKRSLGGVSLVDLTAAMGQNVKTSLTTQAELRSEAKVKFYSKFQAYANLNAKLWGPTIIVGPNHRHFSQYDQQRDNEKNGRYQALGPIPDAFMLNEYGLYVPWVAPPLSDSRSISDWVVETNRFFIGGDMGENDDQVSDQTIINRVGYYVFH